jgi:hypothetical protein
MSADEGLNQKKTHRPFLSSMHSALTTSNFGMSFSSTPIELNPTRPKTKSLDLKPIEKRKPTGIWAIPPNLFPAEVLSDEDSLPQRIRQSRYHPENRKHAQVKSVHMHDRLTRYVR